MFLLLRRTFWSPPRWWRPYCPGVTGPHIGGVFRRFPARLSRRARINGFPSVSRLFRWTLLEGAASRGPLFLKLRNASIPKDHKMDFCTCIRNTDVFIIVKISHPQIFSRNTYIYIQKCFHTNRYNNSYHVNSFDLICTL